MKPKPEPEPRIVTGLRKEIAGLECRADQSGAGSDPAGAAHYRRKAGRLRRTFDYALPPHEAWAEYERRKAALQAEGLSPAEYERALGRVMEELGL